jgi:hypothetical protein
MVVVMEKRREIQTSLGIGDLFLKRVCWVRILRIGPLRRKNDLDREQPTIIIVVLKSVLNRKMVGKE